MDTGGEPFTYHHDGLGSAVALTHSAGEPEWSSAYEPFGATGRETRHQILGAPENRMRFTGEYHDGASGLYHLRAREYDTGTGRFVTADPLSPGADDPYTSAYLYAKARPTRLMDPSGLRGEPLADLIAPSLAGYFSASVMSSATAMRV